MSEDNLRGLDPNYIFHPLFLKLCSKNLENFTKFMFSPSNQYETVLVMGF